MPAWISNADKHPDAFTLKEYEDLEEKRLREKELKKIMHLGRGEK